MSQHRDAQQFSCDEIVANDYAGLARFIAEGNPLPWVEYALKRHGQIITAHRKSDESAPFRADQRRRLERVVTACRTLALALDDRAFTVFLREEGNTPSASAHTMIAALRQLEAEAARVAANLATKRGPGLAYPEAVQYEDFVTGQDLCAWTVMQAMTGCRGASPGIDNPDAHRAMNALWVLCGGNPLGNADNDPSGWRKRIISVRRIEGSKGRAAAWLHSFGRMFESLPRPD